MGMSQHRRSFSRLSVNSVDDRGDILEFSCESIWLRFMGAGPSTSPIHGVDCELGLQCIQDGLPASVIGHRAMNQDERRSRTGLPIGNLGAIERARYVSNRNFRVVADVLCDYSF